MNDSAVSLLIGSVEIILNNSLNFITAKLCLNSSMYTVISLMVLCSLLSIFLFVAPDLKLEKRS